MPDIMLLLSCLRQSLDQTNVRRLARIVEGLLSVTGRVTMLGLSRWTERGGSYRTIQRLFSTTIDWAQVHWQLIRTHLLGEDSDWVLAGDEVVVTKAGKQTYGLGRFFSSLYGKTVPGLCFLNLSLINVERGCSHTVRLEPIVKESADSSPKGKKTGKKKSAANRKATAAKPKGRPKGSRNRNRREVSLSPYLLFVQGIIRSVLNLLGPSISLQHFVYDGALGHNAALQMVRQTALHLVSKLHRNAALFEPYRGEYSGRGRRPKYGDRLDYQQLPEQHLNSDSTQQNIRTLVYQLPVWHKLFPDLLNVVIIVKINTLTQARAHVVLFSSDPDLSYERMIQLYRLRFQLEFQFRDAKQYWGLEDFMSTHKTPVYNSANLALFMVSFSQVLIRPLREHCPAFSVNDLKALFRGYKYAREIIKNLPKMPTPISIDSILPQLAQLGRVNQPLARA